METLSFVRGSTRLAQRIRDENGGFDPPDGGRPMYEEFELVGGVERLAEHQVIDELFAHFRSEDNGWARRHQFVLWVDEHVCLSPMRMIATFSGERLFEVNLYNDDGYWEVFVFADAPYQTRTTMEAILSMTASPRTDHDG